MRATVLRTDRGTRLFWTFQDNRGYFFDAEGCYQYCQENGAKGKIQARKLIHLSKKILDHTEPENWYRYRNNFMDLEIDIVLDDWNVVQLRIPDHGCLPSKGQTCLRRKFIRKCKENKGVERERKIKRSQIIDPCIVPDHPKLSVIPCTPLTFCKATCPKSQ